jgi:hypothetical protein
MGKQTFNRTKNKIEILLAVFLVVILTVALIGTCGTAHKQGYVKNNFLCFFILTFR